MGAWVFFALYNISKNTFRTRKHLGFLGFIDNASRGGLTRWHAPQGVAAHKELKNQRKA